MMNRMKWLAGLSIIILIPAILVACTNNSNNSKVESYTDPDAVLKAAWQYVVYQMDNNKDYEQINGAKITRLELVDTYKSDSAKLVEIYSLEYSLFINRQDGWVPGSTELGSPYLFIVNNGGSPQIIGSEYSKDILENGGYSKTANKLIANNEVLDFAKHSSDVSDTDLYSQEDIQGAINIVKSYYASDNQLLINLWYDKGKCLAQIDEYKKSSTLYGMSDAAARGDLLILYNDIYSLNSDSEQLMRERNIILMRDSKDASWKIIDQGY